MAKVRRDHLRKYLPIFVIASFCVYVITNSSVSTSVPAPRLQLKTSENVVVNTSSTRPKKILIWNRYWKSYSLWNKIFQQLVYRRCPISNCHLTIDRSESSTADAILFHLVDIPREKYQLPPQRSRLDQLWIALSFEPPYIVSLTNLNLTRLNGVFNRTMTYRRDSDITALHGHYHLRNSTLSVSEEPRYISNWVNSRDPVSHRNYASDKRRLVAWFASSRGCRSQSGREKYVEQLQKHVQVDIYGSCGPFKCGTQKTMRNPYKVEHDDCYMLVSRGYKFVLAFENSICEDYATEKLFNNLKLNVVPIVFGGANYSSIAPPHSVIDASRYTPKELAEYLQLLDTNDELYNEYFGWKSKYFVEANDGVLLICDLCAKLNDEEWTREIKVYDKFETWFTDKCWPSFEAQVNISYAESQGWS